MGKILYWIVVQVIYTWYCVAYAGIGRRGAHDLRDFITVQAGR